MTSTVDERRRGRESISPPVPEDRAGLVERDDLLTEIAKLPEDFPNYGDWPVHLPAGHWRALAALLSGTRAGQTVETIGEPCAKCNGYRVPGTGRPEETRAGPGMEREAVAALVVAAKAMSERLYFDAVAVVRLKFSNEETCAAWGELEDQIAAVEGLLSLAGGERWRPDTEGPVNFYERDFYPLSNFSAFTLLWEGRRYDTAEAAYHSEKFWPLSHHAALISTWAEIRQAIREAPSAHEAFKIAERHKERRRPDWDDVKVDVMRRIIRAKAEQHEYVRRKLLATGDRPLVEGSWRDDFWGAGADGNGQNMLGKLWMELRAELRSSPPRSAG